MWIFDARRTSTPSASFVAVQPATIFPLILYYRRESGPSHTLRAEAARCLRLRYRNCDFEWSCHSLNQCIIFHGTLQSDLDVRSFNFFPFYYRSLVYLCTRESSNTSALSAHEREVNLGRRYIPFILVTYVFIDIEEDRLILYKQLCHVKSHRT